MNNDTNPDEPGTETWALTRAMSALENWGRHHAWCDYLRPIPEGKIALPCNCGLEEAINATDPGPRALLAPHYASRNAARQLLVCDNCGYDLAEDALAAVVQGAAAEPTREERLDDSWLTDEARRWEDDCSMSTASLAKAYQQIVAEHKATIAALRQSLDSAEARATDAFVAGARWRESVTTTGQIQPAIALASIEKAARAALSPSEPK